jgi:predicted DNA-binding ribbon-helix-helix protein
MTISSIGSRLALCGVVALISACAQIKAPPYAADYEALDMLKRSRPAPTAVETVLPTDPDHHVNNLRLRSAAMVSSSGTFSKYLENALMHDLKEMSAYDAASTTRLSATILTNEISVGNISTGIGQMEVAVQVHRDGQLRLSKTYAARIEFESGFAAMVAIPAGQLAYPQLVRALLRTMYSDPQFAAAISK